MVDMTTTMFRMASIHALFSQPGGALHTPTTVSRSRLTELPQPAAAPGERLTHFQPVASRGWPWLEIWTQDIIKQKLARTTSTYGSSELISLPATIVIIKILKMTDALRRC